MQVRSRYPLILLLLSVFATLLACTEEQTARPVVRIAYLPITHALPVLIEKEGHTGAAYDVELIRYGSWPELMDALNTGRVDGASALAVLAVKAREQGIPLKMVALGHRGGNVVVAGPQIASAADLKNRTIAVPHRQSSHHLLVRLMLEKAGLLPQDVRIIELSPPEMPAALARGDIDAYCVAEPFGAQAVALGAGTVLHHGDELWPGSLCCALVFNQQFLEQRPEAAAQYLHAYTQAAIATNPKTAEATAAKELKVDSDLLAMSLDWISFDDLTIRPEDYAELTTLMRRFGLSATPPPFEEAVGVNLAR